MIKRVVYTALTVLWMIFIFYMSSQSAEVSGGQSDAITRKIIGVFIDNPSVDLVSIVETIIRKLSHFLEYALLSFLSFKTFVSYGISRKRAFVSVIIAILYAISDEIHQYFVPGRACRFFDIFVDSLGSFAGWYINKLFSRKN
ncbi:MAG: VanZ family protein [Ruminococcaceae bacterium]|nr:VanZ family protein [Oscillospiraceae bacterium]